MTRVHGGPDALGVPRWDFSTNSNACGPCPTAWQAVRTADATQYPDPSYAGLRTALGAFHAVEPERIVLAASASEAIQRLTAWVARHGGRSVALPTHAYGDYVQAARAWGLALADPGAPAALAWLCEPSSPLGQSIGDRLVWDAQAAEAGVRVFDRAYEPLRLEGACAAPAPMLDRLWQLWTPNKALGLTGVRAAYLVAPTGMGEAVAELDALAPSWPVGAHGVALLQAWIRADTQAWLDDSRITLRGWKTRLIAMLADHGWTCLPSQANFFCARPPEGVRPERLRAHGIKLRDATSFGLPGYWRMSVQPPPAQQVLREALHHTGSPA